MALTIFDTVPDFFDPFSVQNSMYQNDKIRQRKNRRKHNLAKRKGELDGENTQELGDDEIDDILDNQDHHSEEIGED